MSVVDASALLAFVLDEPGSDTVEQSLLGGAVCSGPARGSRWVIACASRSPTGSVTWP